MLIEQYHTKVNELLEAYKELLKDSDYTMPAIKWRIGDINKAIEANDILLKQSIMNGTTDNEIKL